MKAELRHGDNGVGAARPPASVRAEPAGRRTETVAEVMGPLLRRLFGPEMPMQFGFWDDSLVGPDTGARLVVRSPEAFRRLLWAPGELGMARAYVAGDLDLEVTGSGEAGRDGMAGVLKRLHDATSRELPAPSAMALPLIDAARKLKLFGSPPPPPAAEVRLSGPLKTGLHSKERDAAAIRHHYDIGNEFYELVLGPAMTYSCARFESPEATLEQAQASKHELVCRKLGLAEEHDGGPRRLLDVGCGWGSMVMHAALHHGAQAVGVTLSPAQAESARRRVADAGLSEEVEIRVQDYRELTGERFDAVSSIGMFEHVGKSRMGEYFSTIHRLLRPTGRLLNHAISKVGGSRMRGRTFMNRYVFPDGELIDVAEVVEGMERAGFEVRDVESLREHYAVTLRHWVANLEQHWDAAVALVGEERARVWRFYMSASVNAFEDGGIAVHQVLGVKPDASGRSGVPATRSAWG
ncbi:MAG TPA: cyclopropane-fatty-acyl-phospholipid synthase family protein [Acidimicrobiales bacterium]|nr:cyclopropane-fatty-acyl-phospholipid synthase family protein [Acidimicrobiales bacterium]